MSKKWLPFVIVILLGIALFFVRRAQNKPPDPAKKTETTSRKTKDPAAEPDRNRGFDRRVSYIEYTKHAKCRMECRKITQAEVEQIMRDGAINYKKSDVEARPCPTYALEGVTNDNQRVRIVFAQCDNTTKVVTRSTLERTGSAIVQAMIINTKTSVDETTGLALFHLCPGGFSRHHAVDLSFCSAGKFPRPHKGRECHPGAMPVLG